MGKITAGLFAAVFFAVNANAATYYVDNMKGADSNDGSKEKPFASIERGIAALAASDRLEVAANPGRPYTRPYPGVNGLSYTVNAGGSIEKPLVINGNGAVLSGLAVVPAEKWKKISEQVYALPFWPMSNLYKTDKRFDYWNPALKIWFVDGVNASNALSRTEMEKNPGNFWWSRAEKTVYFHLPEGKKLEELKVELPANSGFQTNGDHCLIENFTFIFSWNDGFDTGGLPRNTVYKNCVAIDNCGQAFSCHGESFAIYEDCVAIRCGSAGSCNAHNSQASYIRCIFADNVFEAGVFNYDTAMSRFYDSLIIDNRPEAQIWGHSGGGFLFSNCVIKSPDAKLPVMFLRNGAVTMVRCTVMGGQYFNLLQKDSLAAIKLDECLIGDMKDFLFDLRPAQYKLNRNIYFNISNFKLNGRTFPATDFPVYQTAGGCDRESAYYKNIQINRTTGVPDAVRPKPDIRIGAILPGSVWAQYEKYRNVRTAPSGIIFENRK